MNVNRRTPEPCPHCGAMADSSMGAAFKGTRTTAPRHKAGDVVICIRCAGLAIYTDSTTMKRRKMTYLEELDLDDQTKKLVNLCRSQVRGLTRENR